VALVTLVPRVALAAGWPVMLVCPPAEFDRVRKPPWAEGWCLRPAECVPKPLPWRRLPHTFPPPSPRLPRVCAETAGGTAF